MNKEKIIEIWGKDFGPLSENPNIEFGNEEITVKLQKPIKTEEGIVDKIILHEPDAGNLQATDECVGDVDRVIILISQCSGVLKPYVRKIKGRDFMNLNRVVLAFLPNGL